MADKIVTVEIGDDHVAELTLNRPAQLNTFNTALAWELEQALLELDERQQVRVIILKGAGEGIRAFLEKRRPVWQER